MLHIGRRLPGEWEGTLNPEDYGFGVIQADSLTRWEEDERVAKLYQGALELTGVRIPQLDPVLERVSARRLALAELGHSPVQALFERHDVEYPYSCAFGDAQLTIDEGVFCPTFTRVSPLLLGAVDFRPGESVLDSFAGSGAFGINAALRGATRVVSVDISEKAVDCIEKNARDNRVVVDVRLGSVSERVSKDEKFDLIIANPPLLPGESGEGLTAAVFDKGLQATLDFIGQLRHNLSPTGRCYLITSDIMDRCKFSVSDICHRNGLSVSAVCSEDFGYETYSVHKITHRPRFGLRWLLHSR